MGDASFDEIRDAMDWWEKPHITLNYEAVLEKVVDELERVIGMRSQGIWYDLTDKKNDKMNETTMTGCSVVPTREIIEIWEQCTGKKWAANPPKELEGRDE